MLRGIYTSASGMIAQMDRQDTISNNLANVNTNGFKKDQTVIKEHPEFKIYRKDDEKEITPFENRSILTPIGKLGTGVVVKEVATIFEQGTLKQTGNNLDFAIQGEEFFVAESKQGIKFTKSGNFRADSKGFLTTQTGDKVLGISANGKIGYIKISGDFTIGKGGSLQGEAAITGKVKKIQNIKINKGAMDSVLSVKVNDKKNLKKEGSNYYSIKDVKDAYTSNETMLKQGFLEMSNINTVKEMVEMISCSRSYETNQKVLTAQDETLGRAVNDVGKWV